MALSQASARDVVLLAGKGHEDYQETARVYAGRFPTRTEALGRAAASSRCRLKQDRGVKECQA
jgi:hypothetical protein